MSRCLSKSLSLDKAFLCRLLNPDWLRPILFAYWFIDNPSKYTA